jgi:ABC-type Mn2+/Zn2+ transport system permease subunit
MPDLMEPLQFEFFRRAILAAGLVGMLCGMVGVYIVLRGLSYIGHGLSHAIFGGAVVSYVSGINFYIGATIWGAVAAFLINVLSRRREVSGDAAIGVITTSAFAIGVALISREGRFTRNFEAALFGQVLGITPNDLYIVGATVVVVGVALLVMWKQLLFVTFDPEVAATYGVRTTLVEGFFSVVLAATVIVSLQVLGVTLIAAALVIPPVTARLLTDSFTRMFALATALGLVTGASGVYISWFAEIASGASVVLLQASVFVVVLGYAIVRRRVTTLAGRGAPQPLPAINRPGF